jgi:vitamin B12 transporter
MDKKIIGVVANLGLVCAQLPAWAQETQKNYQLNEVVVTASKSPRKQSEIGKVVRVISANQLEQNQGRSLTELLNQVAGLTIGGNGNNPGDIKALYLRGASAGNTLILLDGVPVNDASNISGEYDISAIAIDQIERIEILKGGNSTLYGSDAVAGVINIILKKGKGPLNATTLATAGSYKTFKQALGISGTFAKTTLAVNASNSSSAGFSSATAIPANNLEKDGFSQQSLQANVQQAVSARLKLFANLQANKNKADLDDGAFADLSDYTYDKQTYLFGLGAQYITGNAVIGLTGSKNKVDSKFSYVGDLTRNEGDISQVEATLSTPLAPFADLISGLSYKESATDQLSPWGSLSAKNHISSAYSSFFFKLGEHVRTELGGRLNRHSEYGNNATYTINPSYVFANRYKFFINFSSAYKVPSLYQLFSEYGNLGLKPERTKTFEAGADMELIANKLTLNTAYFKRNIADVIGFDINYRYINQAKQYDEGLELEWKYKWSSKINLDGFYAFVTGKLVQADGQTEANLFRRPKHSLGLNLRATLSPKFTAALYYKWMGSRQDSYYDAALGQGMTVDLKAYNLLDAYVQYTPKQSIKLFVDAKNILDIDYVDFTGYTTKGFNLNVGLLCSIR